MSVHTTHLRRSLRATASVSVLAIAACSADGATGPARDVEGPRNPSPEVFVPVGPIIPCVDSIFKADFSSDAIDGFPNVPAIGSWSANQSAGFIRVRANIGWMYSRSVEVAQYGGPNGVVTLKGKIRCTSAPSTGVVEVEWRSLVHSATASSGAIVLRDAGSRILAAMEYRANGVVTYNGVTVPGVTWITDIPRRYRIHLDLTARKSWLYADGYPKVVSVPYFNADAINLWRISLELSGTSGQSFAWDDIVAVRSSY
jgi:hypothetical protein